MKKRFIFAALFSLFALVAMQLNAQTIAWPAGKAEFQTPTVAALDSTVRAEVTNTFTHLTINLTKNATLHLDTSKKLRAGSFLFVDAICGSVAKSLTCGDLVQCPVISGTINKGRTLMFVHNGTKFMLVSSTQYN